MTQLNPELINLFNEHFISLPKWIGDFNEKCLVDFFHFLRNNNERGGFFSKRDSNLIFERHFYESLIFVYYVTKALNVSRETKVADAGSGPGLPGYFFHCLKETPYVTLIDSSKRRLGILEKECVNKDLNNLEFIFERIENIRNRFDLVTARALIPFPFIIEVFSSSIRTGGHAVLFAADNKSLHKTEKEYLDKLGFVSRETLVPDEINVEFTRTIKILEKVKKSSQGYPRPWRKIKEEISVWQKSSV